ncbi:MAG: hypothetical protein ACYTF7_11575 [Planctomycetota bacterium]|jgi:hypothetical protein
MTTSARSILRSLCASALILAWHTPSALAQDALGTGNALDANPRVGSAGQNARARDFAAELRYRNAIITGNAPGGFSFRGVAGYTASSEFRGRLSSDDLFSFRRDTYLSSMLSIGGQSLRSSDALFIQTQLQSTGTTTIGFNPIISRSPSWNANASSGFLDPSVDPSMARFTQQPGALRATSSLVTGQALSPSVISAPSPDADTARYLIASPIGGITERTIDLSQSPNDRVWGRADGRVTSQTSSRLDASTDQPTTTSLLERLRSHYEQDEGEDEPATGHETLEDRINRIKEELDRVRRNDPEDPADLDEAADSLQSDEPFKVDRFVDPNRSGESFFNEHMRGGQELLAEGRWFLAEERFSAALGARPDSPLAGFGRVHAQLGAGLFRSSSIQLRALLEAHPEMLGVRFDAALLPRASRLDLLVSSLRSQSSGSERSDRDTAFLLAYLAWQHDRVELISEAFVQIERINDALDDTEPLYELAQKLWLTPAAERQPTE